MGKENEIQILDVDKKQVAGRLKALNAKHTGSHKFKRVEFLLKGKVKGWHSWGRVRTDGKETTITLKEFKGNGGFTSMDEFEIKTDDFAGASELLTRLVSPKVIIYFENDREAYSLGKAHITIDKWPKIPTFVEIEAPTMQEVRRVNKLLKIKGKIRGNMSIHKVYDLYGLDFHKVMSENEPKLRKLLGKS